MKTLFTFLLCLSTFFAMAQFELDSVKSKWSSQGREDIEGVYTLASGTNPYSVVLTKFNDTYKLVYIEGKQPEWLYGDLKAIIAPSDEKIYEGRWNAGVPSAPLLEDVKVVFGDSKFILYWSDWSIDEFKMIYPIAKGAKELKKVKIDDELFVRDNMNIAIQQSDSGMIEIPVTINDVLKIYVGLEKMSGEILVSKDIAKTLIQTKSVGFKDWTEGSYYDFINSKKPFKGPHVFNISRMQFGTKELKNVKAKVTDDLDRAMVINIDMLKKLGKVYINLEENVLTITNN